MQALICSSASCGHRRSEIKLCPRADTTIEVIILLRTFHVRITENFIFIDNLSVAILINISTFFISN